MGNRVLPTICTGGGSRMSHRTFHLSTRTGDEPRVTGPLVGFGARPGVQHSPARHSEREGGSWAGERRGDAAGTSLAHSDSAQFTSWLLEGWPRVRRALVVAAHPDDETIGAGALLGRLPGCAVVHLTEGVPRDLTWAPAALAVGWDGQEYGSVRRRELEAAMAVAGVPAERLVGLGAVDQEAVFAVGDLARRLGDLLAEMAPEVVLAPAYEGGHPDHDAAALVVRAAAGLLARGGRPVPALVEMALYHAGPDGGLVTGEFLPGAAPVNETAVLVLAEAERERKRRMIETFASQRATLAPFGVEVERFRPAPRCDFSRPPHAGPLWYERLGFPLSGERWRAEARRALAGLGLPEVLG
jgi:N-acetylglucosamine malate deacetylase 2